MYFLLKIWKFFKIISMEFPFESITQVFPLQTVSASMFHRISRNNFTKNIFRLKSPDFNEFLTCLYWTLLASETFNLIYFKINNETFPETENFHQMVSRKLLHMKELKGIKCTKSLFCFFTIKENHLT